MYVKFIFELEFHRWELLRVYFILCIYVYNVSCFMSSELNMHCLYIC